jgi:hypothetical protein
VLSFIFVLASCSATTGEQNTLATTIIPGKTECENDGDVSPDGNYVCKGRGMFYWQPLYEVETPAQSMEDRYRECVSIKQDLPGLYLRVIESLMNDDSELGVWFTFHNQIKEELRGRVSQRSKDLMEKRQVIFDRYQILQCELNFPVLKDPEDDSNSIPEEPWTPSGVL